MQTFTSPQPFSLSEQVNAAVTHHPHLKQRRVSLKTEQGRVTINGAVQSYYEKQLAQEAVRKIEGIQSVENQLEVVWPQ